MPRKNRPYKKGEPFRDASLFVIVAEGEREDKYFRYFEDKSQRIKIEIVRREPGKSAPKHFLERIETFINENNWDPADKDELWIVLDVDKWPKKIIHELVQYCTDTPNWFIAISNPCFEVWLHYHHNASLEDKGQRCQDLKKGLEKHLAGNFPKNTCELISTACKNAKKADKTPKSDHPNPNETKVYKLGEKIVKSLKK